MILYTMMPEELIFPAEGDVYSKQKLINLDGIPLMVELDDDQSYRVIRVLSSDPQHFMDSRCTPGAKISF
ncbi:ribonuclease [Bacillus canaveralius]|uniref:Ribonuclease n=1 Tax=Bacillus canaveralius TaxID=1403243 RepID=A0A2N5GP93_9BACI|nr:MULTISPECIES: YlzJ-like family protein [Bacillus]PLR84269.1 ribonuclease [Bacillus canaveralius]PLR87412.1 ribonuclease [Bacillus sp. V33-4]PLR89447.1 ribonuclease [Bacillus canaveralius]RSK54873.1 ribonuclease [Bacillus canaveralius]